MASKLTQADQYAAIGDGLAVGCADLGVTALTTAKVELELSFNHAWRNWSPASMFPQVRGNISRCDLLTILHKSPGRRWSRVVWTQTRGWWEPTPRGVDDLDEVALILAGTQGVDRERWTELAAPFVERLGNNCVRRAA